MSDTPDSDANDPRQPPLADPCGCNAPGAAHERGARDFQCCEGPNPNPDRASASASDADVDDGPLVVDEAVTPSTRVSVSVLDAAGVHRDAAVQLFGADEANDPDRVAAALVAAARATVTMLGTNYAAAYQRALYAATRVGRPARQR